MTRRGNRWLAATAMMLALLLGWTQTSRAQSSTNDQYEDVYGDEDVYDEDNMALGLGAGIVLPNDDGNEDGEIYYALNFRWRIFDHDEDDGDRDDTSASGYNERHNRRHYRGRYPGEAGSDAGIRGFIEPEVAYWKRSEEDREAEDLLLGLNLVGVVPTRSADFFFGVGFGYHLLDGESILRDNTGREIARVDLKDERLGGNVQVGVELHVSESMGLFGSGRLDILEDKPFDRQTKVWGGIRFHF